MTDSESLQSLLLWARDQGFVLTRVKFGDLEVDVAPLLLHGSAPAGGGQPDEEEETDEEKRRVLFHSSEP